ncbi:hypothetical protein HNQ79_001253 [Streptomyces candidus]|uniref:Chaplin domain-containing protein n=1 Tax=Streptomyces candidus TaxID=67283 RepID=A0A7X0LNF3_9ACTN|nr:hypothetical protein [Streptomyces candidus]GHH41843.1 hypothetical protein GCM10018773_25690 [Streptomyces candidus]
MLVTAAVSGVLSMTGGHAYADAVSEGTASDSPGALSGNSAQVPAHVPVNACGNTVDVIGLLNPAFGNKCANGPIPPAGRPPTGTPRSHEPPAEEPPAYEHPAEEPPAYEHPADQPPADEPPADVPPTDQPPKDQPPADEPPTDQPPADEEPPGEPPVDQPPSEQPPADQPPSGKPPVGEPPVVVPPVVGNPPVGKPPVSRPPSEPTPGKSAGPGKPRTVETPVQRAEAGKALLADTGAGELGGAAALSMALLGGGVLLTRRGRVAQR